MSETKLLPCPFCGGNASLLEKADEFGNYSVMCTRARCMAEGSPCYSVEAAIAEWNHRALTPKQEAAEDLYEALEAQEEADRVCEEELDYIERAYCEGWDNDPTGSSHLVGMKLKSVAAQCRANELRKSALAKAGRA